MFIPFSGCSREHVNSHEKSYIGLFFNIHTPKQPAGEPDLLQPNEGLRRVGGQELHIQHSDKIHSHRKGVSL